MSKTEQEHRRDIVEVGRLVYEKGWVAANDGNLSVRLDGGRVLCTPTGVSKGRMQEEDLIVCSPHGEKLAGERECTSELRMHLTIYGLRPDVQAVVHTHAPTATGFAVAGRPLNIACLPEVIVGLGCVPLADYGLPGTPALSESLRPYIPKYDAILMRNHGVVCSGADLWSAYYKMETVEHFARITLVAELLGGAQALPRADVEALFAARSRYGVRSHAGLEPGFPLVAEDLPAQEERLQVTRGQLLALVDEALRMRR